MTTSQLARPMISRRSVSETEWRGALWRACSEDNQIASAYQPVVELQTGSVQGFEMLARFPEEPHGGPEAWFAAAARHGLEGVLAAFIVRGALAARRQAGPGRFLSVNVTPRALMAGEVQTAFRSFGRLDGIVVEVTEQSALGAYDELNGALAPLRALGASVAVDDADSGYASLRQIAALRPDHVKVHQSLIAGLDRDDAKATVVRTLQDFSRRVGARLIAEGVERTEELDTLLELEVALAQGFALGRPAPEMHELAPDVVAFLRGRAARARRPAADDGPGAPLGPGDSSAPQRAEGIAPQPPPAAAERPQALSLIDRAAPVAAADGHPGLTARFLSEPGRQFLAVVDPVARPVALAVREATLRGESPILPLVVGPASPVRAVADRIRARPLPQRGQPLIVCDAADRYLGLVPMSWLLRDDSA